MEAETTPRTTPRFALDPTWESLAINLGLITTLTVTLVLTVTGELGPSETEVARTFRLCVP